jgi:hypothetical protein
VNVVKLFRRVGGLIIGVVGIIFLVSGLSLILSQNWTRTTGTVQSCTARLIHTGTSSHSQQDCTVTWRDGNVSHTSTVTVGVKPRYPGQSVPLRVHGDTAAEPTPRWEGWVVGGAGLVLFGTGVVLVWPRRNRPTPVTA